MVPSQGTLASGSQDGASSTCTCCGPGSGAGPSTARLPLLRPACSPAAENAQCSHLGSVLVGCVPDHVSPILRGIMAGWFLVADISESLENNFSLQ